MLSRYPIVMNAKAITTAAAIMSTLALVLALGVPALVHTADAALTCETKSGNAPPGQQEKPLKDGCEGSKLVKTPSGNAPAGQNP